MSEETRNDAERRAAFVWPAFIIFLLLIPVAAAVVLIRAANGDPSFAVEEDYYERAQAWDEEAAQRSLNRELGWSVQLFAGRAGGERLLVQVRLLDAAGRELEADSFEIEAFAVARAAQRRQLDLQLGEDGSWEAATPIERGGLWEFRCTVRVGETRFTEVIRRDLGGYGAL